MISRVITLCFQDIIISSRTGAVHYGRDTQKPKAPTSITREEQDCYARMHCEESRQKGSQISFPLEQDCTVSNKVPEKTDSVNR